MLCVCSNVILFHLPITITQGAVRLVVLKWQPTPVFLPGESQGRRSLVGCRLWGRTESDTPGVAQQQQQQQVMLLCSQGREPLCLSFSAAAFTNYSKPGVCRSGFGRL